MKKITIYSILAAVLLFTACDIDRLPYGSMPDESIKNDPGASLNTLLTGTYSQLKGWSDVMHHQSHTRHVCSCISFRPLNIRIPYLHQTACRLAL
jgi:hypothetical protein